MRATIGLLLMALPLAGCQSETQFKQRWRETAIQACLQAAEAQQLPAGLDPPGICNCSVDRIMAGKSAADLRSYRPGPADGEAAAQCALEAAGQARQQDG